MEMNPPGRGPENLSGRFGGPIRHRIGAGEMMSDDREHRIRQRAHEIWEREGRPSGRDREHWERAKRDVDSGLDKADPLGSHTSEDQGSQASESGSQASESGSQSSERGSQASAEHRSQATVESPGTAVPPGQDESQASVAAKAKKTIESGKAKKATGATKSGSAKKPAAARKSASAGKPERNA
jgi:hypothetical protein